MAGSAPSDALPTLEPDPGFDAPYLASAIALSTEPGDRPALDELGDAMLIWASDDVVDRLMPAALDAVWDAELEQDIRKGLDRVGARSDWGGSVEAARADLDARGRDSAIARAIVQDIAREIGREGVSTFFCACCLEESIEHAAPEERRRIACRVAEVGARDVGIGADELRAALGTLSTAGLARALATEERRTGLRARLARIARLGASSSPELARELEALLREPPPVDPADDPLWAALCASLVRHLHPDLN